MDIVPAAVGGSSAIREPFHAIEYRDKPEWLAARRKKITATDVGRIVKVSPYGGPLAVYNEKLGLDQDETERMLLGRELQAGIASAYHQIRAKKTGESIELKHASPLALHIHEQNPRHAASLDAWQRIDHGPWHPLEVKNSRAHPAEPYDIWITQLQWQLHVTGAQRGTIAALCAGEELMYWDLDRDDDLIQPLALAADAFMAQFVDLATPPPPDGARDADAIRRLYAEATPGTEITLTIEDLDLALQLLASKEALGELEKRIDGLKAQLQGRMGAAEVAYLPNGARITWKNQDRRSYVVPAQRLRVFRIERK